MTLIRKTEILTLYSSWEQILTQQAHAISREFPNTSDLQATLKIKDLLYTGKDHYFQQFFLQEQNKAVIKQSYQALSALPQAETLLKLNQEIERVKGRIANVEKQLLAPIGPVAQCVSGIVRFFTHNSYAIRADFLVESQDRALQSANLGQLSAPLERSYLRFSKTLTAGGLFALDLAQWRWLGFSQTMLSSMTQLCMPNASSWISLFHYLNMDEKITLSCLPVIHGIFDYIGFVGINSYSYGFSFHSFTQITLSYLLALGTGYVSAKAIDTCYRFLYKGRPLHAIPTYSFVRGITQWVAFPLTVTYALPFLFKQLTPYFQDVLIDEKTCFEHKELCKKEARKVLGLPESAPLQEVKNAFNALALQYHPDKNPNGAEKFRQIAQAKKFCFALEQDV